jgi:hypothetical protein
LYLGIFLPKSANKKVTMLDLRRSGSLSIEDAKKITSIQVEVRSEYNDFVETLVASNKVSDFQWLLQITARNTYASWIFDSMCRLRLLETLLQEGRNITHIKIDNQSLKGPILQILESYKIYSNITIVKNNRNKNFQLIRNLLKNIYICLCLWISSILFKANSKPKGEVYFLDSFILRKSFDKNHKLTDRYYPNLVSNLPNNVQGKVWYLSTLSGLKYPLDWIKIFNHVSKSKNNIILKEHWLNFKDYLYAIWKSIFLAKTIKNIPNWGGIDISKIVIDEIKNDQASNSITQGILMYLFFKRLKTNQCEIIGVIDWFENQIIDRGLYLGMNKFFPKVYIKGYLGFIPEDYYVGIFPTQYEMQSNLLPDELLVVGNAYIDNIKQYCPELKVNSAPAFRFQHVFEFERDSDIEKNIILLALPMKVEEIQNIFNVISELNLDKKYRLIIKAHPVTNIKNTINSFAIKSDILYEISELPLNKIFQSTRLLITTSSSVALEAVSCGIYVVIIGNRSGPTINRLSGYVDKKYWSICYSALEIMSILNKENSNVGIEIKKYFQLINKAGTIQMMTFNKK